MISAISAISSNVLHIYIVYAKMFTLQSGSDRINCALRTIRESIQVEPFLKFNLIK